MQNSKTLTFVPIKLDWFKELAKRYIKHEISNGVALGVVSGRLSTLRRFSSYLADSTDISDIKSITRVLVLRFISEYFEGKKNNTIIGNLGCLRHFFDTGNQHGWFAVSQHLIRDEDYPKGRRYTPNDIPSSVFEKLVDKLHKLPDPLARM